MSKKKDIRAVSLSTLNMCPVSGLPIFHRDEWTEVNFGKKYTITMTVVGDRILIHQPSGHATKHDVTGVFQLYPEILKEGLSGQTYVQIEDYSNLKSATMEARRSFIDKMKGRDKLLALIFCNPAPLFRISINLGRRYRIGDFEVHIVENYTEAIRLALKILGYGKLKSPTTGSDIAESIAPETENQQPSGHNKPTEVSTFKMDDFSGRFEFFKPNIIHFEGSGFLHTNLVEPLFQAQEKVISSVLKRGTPYYFIGGVSRVQSSRKARKLYNDHILNFHKNNPFRMYIFYGTNRLLKAAINLYRPFAPFDVYMVTNLNEALSTVEHEERKISKQSHVLHEENRHVDSKSDNRIQKYVDELLHFLGNITWDSIGFEKNLKVDESHPFSPVFDAIELIKTDIDDVFHERIQTEEKQLELEARLQRAQQMEAIGTLAAGVAHDLNNILSGLVGYPDLIMMDLPEESPIRKDILMIKDSGLKAAAIVQDLLTLARRGVPVTKVVLLNELISEFILSPEYKKIMSFHPSVKTNLHLSPALLRIVGSPVHLSKTIMNLISNAAEAMPHGGELTISTENRYIDSPIQGYDEVREGDYATLIVSDSGTGIPELELNRIFEPFYTKKTMGRSGTGLGMAVVWGTVKDHSGYIDIKSIVNCGTTFTLFFPITRQEAEKEAAALSINDYMGNGETVLIVDDVKEQREIASGMLKKMGYSVKTVSTGEAAVEFIKNHPVDLVVLDMIMDPGIDGLETFSRILKHQPGQRAIIASGFSETEQVKAAQRLGAGIYIRKPYTMENLGIAVRDELKK